jgi:hypothetical protein
MLEGGGAVGVQATSVNIQRKKNTFDDDSDEDLSDL